MKTTKDLLDLIELKEIDETTFEGGSITVGSPNVFGGQVLSQALNAAYRTVTEERKCHSFHAYFILPGDLKKPIRFKVQLVRDGGSFTTRYITAEQDDTSIFVMAASFQKKEEGLEFQTTMPEAPEPEKLMSWKQIYEMAGDLIPENYRKFLGMDRPIIIKPALLNNPLEGKDLPPEQKVWFKFNKIDEQLSIQHFHEMLAYASDYNILTTTLFPHASKAFFGNIQMASLDHGMWFHRIPEDFSDWFLYVTRVESNSNARGLARGEVFSKDGQLVATVMQEGLIRRKK